MTKEMEFFLFLIERYAKAKGRMTGDVLREWEDKGITKEIFDGYFEYHQERLENAFDDIDALKMIGYNISVVSRDAGLQGEEAMELLQERFIKRDGIDGKQVMVPYKIILRGSEKCEK